MATVSSPSPPAGHGQAVQHMPAAVPEDEVLNDTSPFETAALPVSSISPSVHETKQPVKKKGICACCFGGSGAKHDDAVTASGEQRGHCCLGSCCVVCLTHNILPARARLAVPTKTYIPRPLCTTMSASVPLDALTLCRRYVVKAYP